MKTEFEIVFREINIEKIRKKLIELGAKCVKENYLMKRNVFESNFNKKNSFFRIRDEWDKITCTYKEISDWKLDIKSVKEIEVEISDYENMINIFWKIWLKQKSYQENYRETWKIENEVYFMIDIWPWLKPYLEIEWESEEIVKKYSKKLWFDYKKWLFWTVCEVYNEELWLSNDYINNLEIIDFKTDLK